MRTTVCIKKGAQVLTTIDSGDFNQVKKAIAEAIHRADNDETDITAMLLETGEVIFPAPRNRMGRLQDCYWPGKMLLRPEAWGHDPDKPIHYRCFEFPNSVLAAERCHEARGLRRITDPAEYLRAIKERKLNIESVNSLWHEVSHVTPFNSTQAVTLYTLIVVHKDGSGHHVPWK